MTKGVNEVGVSRMGMLKDWGVFQRQVRFPQGWKTQPSLHLSISQSSLHLFSGVKAQRS